MEKYLIVGLGNPGEEYRLTRHNIGHWVIDQFKNSQIFDPPVYLKKASVAMNLSGFKVKELIDKHQITLNNLVIIHDDLDILLGEFRIQFGRGSAGHKGVESITRALGSDEYWRLRVGIGRPPEGMEAEDYVLGNFSQEEFNALEVLLPRIREELKTCLQKR